VNQETNRHTKCKAVLGPVSCTAGW